MPENSVRPLKPSPRDSATAASVPSRVAIEADTTPTRTLIQAASIMARSLKNSEYQRSDQPPHTVTSREALKEWVTRITIGRYRNARPSASETTLNGESRFGARAIIARLPIGGAAAGHRTSTAPAAATAAPPPPPTPPASPCW